jgi:hypothetical protein
MGFRMILTANSDYFFKQHWPVDIYVMMKCCAFFAVRTEFLNIIKTM